MNAALPWWLLQYVREGRLHLHLHHNGPTPQVRATSCRTETCRDPRRCVTVRVEPEEETA